MATRQAWVVLAAVLAAAVLLTAPGYSSQPEPPKELTLDLGGGVTMKLVLIPAGKFMMGSPDTQYGHEGNEGPQHEVTISKPFYMGVTEVTQAQYQAIMATNPSKFRGATNPVESVTWNNATEFCKKLSEKTRQAVHLPTEAEWEYACRAGTVTASSFADANAALGDNLGDYAWYGANSGGKTRPVGQKKSNALGLYDMYGNVSEWCGDWYGAYSKGSLTDPQGPASGTDRVVRGSAWNNYPDYSRSASRDFYDPEVRNYYFGFRVVVSVSVPGYSSKPEPSQSNAGQTAKKDVSIAPNKPQLPQGNTGQATKKGISTAPFGSQAEKLKELLLDLGSGVTMKLVLIPAGNFTMGEENYYRAIQHEVAISKPFYLGVTEVTQAQYQAIMGTNPSAFNDATNPVELVSWHDATEFCWKLSEKTRQVVRLPTEAEWEYACRAGTVKAFSFGDADSALGDYAWYSGNSGNTTHPVGQKKPNAWGLYDMHGNVFEWCADWLGYYPKSAVTDPQGPAFGMSRVLRGGSWIYYPNFCRSSLRYSLTPSFATYHFGFRVVVSVSAPGP